MSDDANQLETTLVSDAGTVRIVEGVDGVLALGIAVGDEHDEVVTIMLTERQKMALWEAFGAHGLQQRDEARYNARVLAHAYNNGSIPPESIVQQSLKYPVVSGSSGTLTDDGWLQR